MLTVIRGLCLPGGAPELSALSLYADDTSVIALSDEAIAAVFQVYHHFEIGTGAKLNLSKCHGLWLGPWRNRVDAPVPILWSSSSINVLGIFIGHNDLSQENWSPRLEAIRKCLLSWRGRSLSFSGKALVINALALSRVWYVASLVFMPPWVKAELTRLIFDFFWGGKRDLLARRVL